MLHKCYKSNTLVDDLQQKMNEFHKTKKQSRTLQIQRTIAVVQNIRNKSKPERSVVRLLPAKVRDMVQQTVQSAREMLTDEDEFFQNGQAIIEEIDEQTQIQFVKRPSISLANNAQQTPIPQQARIDNDDFYELDTQYKIPLYTDLHAVQDIYETDEIPKELQEIVPQQTNNHLSNTKREYHNRLSNIQNKKKHVGFLYMASAETNAQQQYNDDLSSSSDDEAISAIKRRIEQNHSTLKQKKSMQIFKRYLNMSQHPLPTFLQ